MAPLPDNMEPRLVVAQVLCQQAGETWNALTEPERAVYLLVGERALALAAHGIAVARANTPRGGKPPSKSAPSCNQPSSD